MIDRSHCNDRCYGEPCVHIQTQEQVGLVIEERIFFPKGMDPDDYNAVSFAVRVQWRGKFKWAVVQGLGHPSHRFLTRTGKWLFLPMPMHRRWCRFDFEEACWLAEEAVENVKVNGLTWAEWEARRSA